MEKNERAKAEIRHMTKDLLLSVSVARLLMDILIEELQKMKARKNQLGCCRNRNSCDDTERHAASGSKYIGTKMIQAEPAWRVTTEDGRQFTQPKSNESDFAGKIEDGYRVVYEDSYESWSPKGAFEAAYRRCDGMNFGLAIEAAKMGKKISRKGWNGKGQYVELATNISYMNRVDEIINAKHGAIGSAALAFVGTSGVQLGWLASQADMLADDWYIVD